ncbi:hypothetical protein [Thermaurantiacus sp.]
MAMRAPVRADALSLSGGQLRELAAEQDRRTVASRSLEIVDHVGTELKPGEPFPPGSVTLMLARRGSKSFSAAVESLKKSGRLDRAAVAALQRGYKGRRLMPVDDALALLQEQPTIAELTGGRFLLASNLFVPDDMELALVAFPWNGGSLAGVSFTFTERSLPGVEGAGLDAVLVRRAPRLTPAEVAALKLIPQTAFDTNIGQAGLCYAITVVLVAAGVAVATSLCPGRLADFHLDDLAIRGARPRRCRPAPSSPCAA